MQGGVKRWHFAGGDATHGSMFHRAPGGIGASSFPSRVWKGQHFPGHMGNERVTVKNLRVVKIDSDENLVAGARSGAGPPGLLSADPQGQEGQVARAVRARGTKVTRRTKDRKIMAVVDVRNLEGKTVGQMDLADEVFAASVNPHLLHESVRWYLAGQRAGTHKTKGRGEVSGSGRKLWRQKGTGRARVGSIRSSIWRKGGTVHGPQPRSYAYALPRKMLVGALRSALSAKLAEQKLTVVDGWTLGSHKTKELRQTLTRLDGRHAHDAGGRGARKPQPRAGQPQSRRRQSGRARRRCNPTTCCGTTACCFRRTRRCA